MKAYLCVPPAGMTKEEAQEKRVWSWWEIESAETIALPGPWACFEFIIHRTVLEAGVLGSTYAISEKSTGCLVVEGCYPKRSAIRDALRRLNSIGVNRFERALADVRHAGCIAPVSSEETA